MEFETMSNILRHASGVAIILLSVWGAGAIYEYATKDYMSWLNAAMGAVMMITACILYRLMFRGR
jgi:succinate dehydrogenase hydrophobic anchor subunit